MTDYGLRSPSPRPARAYLAAAKLRCRRRGFSVPIVLMILSVTLAIVYAAMRTQGTMLDVEQNSSSHTQARQAAIAGLTIALRKIHQSDWAGVGTVLTGDLSASERYEVSYTAGDPSLAAGDPDYDDLPYRVTLLATGYAEPPSGGNEAVHRARAVVRLVPAELAAEPSDWATFQQYTLYQGETSSTGLNNEFTFELPSRIEGPVRVQSLLKIADAAPDVAAARDQYLGDLNLMRLEGPPDYRPFQGPVHLNFNGNADGLARLALLGVATVDTPNTPFSPDWQQPTGWSTYRIYPGGPTYTIESLGMTLQGITLGPDPVANPLGLFYNSGQLEIRSNVTINGTLFCTQDIKITGGNVNLQPFDLPALAGTDQPVRLPVATCGSFIVESTASGSVTGLVTAFELMELKERFENQTFSFTGRVIVAKDLKLRARSEWGNTDWAAAYAAIYGGGGGSPPYFPASMVAWGRNPTPTITFKPDPTPVTYHWLGDEAGVAVYAHAPNDQADPNAVGLTWDLIEWTDDIPVN